VHRANDWVEKARNAASPFVSGREIDYKDAYFSLCEAVRSYYRVLDSLFCDLENAQKQLADRARENLPCR